MQVQEYIGEHTQGPVARGVIVLLAEDRGIDLSLGWIFQAIDLLFGFGRNVGSEGLDILLHPDSYFFDDSDFAAIFSIAACAIAAVRVVCVSHSQSLKFLRACSRARRAAPHCNLHSRQERAIGAITIIEVARLALGP